MTGLVMVGMTQDKGSAIASQVEDLLFVAVEKQGQIDDLIAQVMMMITVYFHII